MDRGTRQADSIVLFVIRTDRESENTIQRERPAPKSILRFVLHEPQALFSSPQLFSRRAADIASLKLFEQWFEDIHTAEPCIQFSPFCNRTIDDRAWGRRSLTL